MSILEFNITINASAKNTWQVLWYDGTYRKWTSAFHEGSYAVSDWKQGSKVHFLNPNGNGMYSIITECKENELMAFKHLGVLKNYEEQPADEETKEWGDAREIYTLKEAEGITTLNVSMDSIDLFEDYMNKTFPVALKLIKDLSEQPVVITIEAVVNAPIEKVWSYWTLPEHIIHWNNASDDWHTPSATNDLRNGGEFHFTMTAKDGSFSFDFNGKYDEVKQNELIAYTMAYMPEFDKAGRGRKAKVNFVKKGNQTKVIEAFEAEEIHSLDLQQMGWQSILNNFKKYTEAN